ncbi:MAG: hypothetical protein IPF98_03340 [Gemmatimonadetes bacterium]|nr:hypothetical protein [Gemmatimonadota bacterium]MCC6772109.1 hypothetical protein [Gemmatimonadaceae bacterium]
MTYGTLATIRRILFFSLAAGLIGTTTELLLLGHFEDWKQYTPLVVLAVAILVQGWYVVSRSARSVRALRIGMWLCIVSGGVGVILHFRGNKEFELEMTPAMAGWELFRESITGATPALAPGSLIPIGLIGLAWAFRHPALGSGPSE